MGVRGVALTWRRGAGQHELIGRESERAGIVTPAVDADYCMIIASLQLIEVERREPY